MGSSEARSGLRCASSGCPLLALLPPHLSLRHPPPRQALASARVDAAQHEYAVLELRRELHQQDALVARLRAQLARAEAKLRAVGTAATASPLGPASPGCRVGSQAPRPPRDSAFGTVAI